MKNILEIRVDDIHINPFQPRKQFGEEELLELKKSIQHYGVLQPLLVAANADGSYTLVAGERRLRAAKLAGLIQVPAVIGDYDDKQKAEIALIENIQRSNLNFLEEAAAIERLLREFGITQEELGQHLGKTQATIANKLRLLRLSAAIQEELLAAGLTERHARALLKLSETQRPQALKHIIQYHLNVQQTEQFVERLLTPRVPTNKRMVVNNVKFFLNSFKGTVDSMLKCGVDADYKHKIDGNDLIITIKVKNAVQQKNSPK